MTAEQPSAINQLLAECDHVQREFLLTRTAVEPRFRRAIQRLQTAANAVKAAQKKPADESRA